MTKWIKRGRMEMACTRLPGVFRLRGGGFYVRARATDAATGKPIEVQKVLHDAPDEHAALAWLREEVERTNRGRAPAPSRERFGPYAVALFRRKVAHGDIKSAKGREKWGVALEHHLITHFGEHYLDAIRKADIEAWKDEIAKLILAGEYSPHTANTWLSVLKVIIESAVADLELPRNPMAGVRPFDTSAHRTYTVEEPNALRPVDVPRFLQAMRDLFPQHYAMVLTGFSTGLRPSSLRPLRRQGEQPDLLWDEKLLLVRRSHTMKDEVMERTKTGADQAIGLPDALLEELRWHVAQLTPLQAESNLLFPSATGGSDPTAASTNHSPLCASGYSWHTG